MAPRIPQPHEILSDPCASTWLKEALLATLKRDLLDAANDAEMLALVLRDKWSRRTSQFYDAAIKGRTKYNENRD